MESTHSKETRVVQDFIDISVKSLEEGESVYVSGGYIQSGDKRILDRNCDVIVNLLSSKGYTYTTNHGYGCRDYRFMKQLNLV